MAKVEIKKKVSIKNRKASFEYIFLDHLTAGIVLTGTEIKSIRLGKASLVDTYCTVINGEMWIKNMYVAPYFYGSYGNHAVRRDRKLLLNRKEIRKWAQEMKNPGLTIVPTELYVNEENLAKVDIVLARGKKVFDKRQTMKEKADRREMDRSFKHY